MQLENRKILFAAQYSAPYPGNFIGSLSALEQTLSQRFGCKIAWTFPVEAEETDWFETFRKDRQVYLAKFDKTLYRRCREIAEDFTPDIIHTHFEGFDVAMLRASKQARTVWHMHDWLQFQPNPLKKAYQVYTFFRHYGWPAIVTGNRLSIIGVCRHEPDFVAPFRLGRKIVESYIPNGIETSRFAAVDRLETGRLFTFLTFGGRNVQKRIDLVLEAAERLSQKYKFSLKVTLGSDTQSVISKWGGVNRPWLLPVPQTKDVAKLYNAADCFISASDCETFSYAVAEATLSGLPVIQSDIEGTQWNIGNPSVFTFEKGSAKSLARMMEKVLLADAAKLHKDATITEGANRRKLSLDCWVEKVVGHYKKL